VDTGQHELNPRLSAILSHLSQPIVLCDVNGIVAQANRSSASLLGATPEGMVGKPIWRTASWPTSANAEWTLASAIGQAASGQRARCELPVVGPHGADKRIEFYIAGSGDDFVVELRIVGGEVEQALRDSEAKARAILDTAVDGIITISETGIIRSFNRAAERLFGYRATEVIGKPVNMLMPEPYRGEHDSYMRAYVQTGVARIIGIGREVVAQRKDGTMFPIDLGVSEVQLRNERIFTGMVRDLTERAALEKKILEISDDEKRRIGQDLHDGLGQTLTGIGFKTTALERKLAAKGLPEAETAQQLSKLVTHAISQSRSIARGLQPLSVERSGVVAALSELTAHVEDLYKLQCHFDCPQPVSVRDTIAAIHLYRIAQEALNNAVKHGRANRITLSLRNDGSTVQLSVRDDGAGFSPPTEASGSGLHIMRYRAAMIGGVLSIDSHNGTGTVVSCVVPENLNAPTGPTPGARTHAAAPTPAPTRTAQAP
jgi:PAS domain S-box-containing protein